MTTIESKHGIVSRQPHELYMSFTDLQNFKAMLPEDKKDMIEATFDTIQATVQGFNIGVKVHERVPYSRIELVDYGAPFAFHIVLHFDPAAEDPYKTDFHVMVEADLNLMMKMMLSGKIKEALDRVVDGLVSVSEGRIPEGLDEETMRKMQEELAKRQGGNQ